MLHQHVSTWFHIQSSAKGNSRKNVEQSLLQDELKEKEAKLVSFRKSLKAKDRALRKCQKKKKQLEKDLRLAREALRKHKEEAERIKPSRWSSTSTVAVVVFLFFALSTSLGHIYQLNRSSEELRQFFAVHLDQTNDIFNTQMQTFGDQISSTLDSTSHLYSHSAEIINQHHDDVSKCWEELRQQRDFFNDQLKQSQQSVEIERVVIDQVACPISESSFLQLETERDNLKSQEAGLRQELADSKKLAETLRHELSDSQNSTESLQQELADSQNSTESLRHELADSQNSTDSLRHELADSQRSRELLRKELTGSKSMVGSLHRQLTDSQKSVESLRNELTNSQKAVETLQHELGDSQKSVQTLQNELTDSQTSAKTSQDELTDSQKSIQTLRNELADSKTSVETLQHELVQSQKSIESLNDLLNQERVSSSQWRYWFRDLQNNHSLVLKDLDVVSASRDELFEKVQDAKAYTQEYAYSKRMMSLKILKLKTKSKDLSNQLGHLEVVNHALQEENKKLTLELSQPSTEAKYESKIAFSNVCLAYSRGYFDFEDDEAELGEFMKNPKEPVEEREEPIKEPKQVRPKPIVFDNSSVQTPETLVEVIIPSETSPPSSHQPPESSYVFPMLLVLGGMVLGQTLHREMIYGSVTCVIIFLTPFRYPALFFIKMQVLLVFVTLFSLLIGELCNTRAFTSSVFILLCFKLASIAGVHLSTAAWTLSTLAIICGVWRLLPLTDSSQDVVVQCPNSHVMKKMTGLPTNLSGKTRSNVTCSVCNTTELQKTRFYHCTLCELEYCCTCTAGELC